MRTFVRLVLIAGVGFSGMATTSAQNASGAATGHATVVTQAAHATAITKNHAALVAGQLVQPVATPVNHAALVAGQVAQPAVTPSVQQPVDHAALDPAAAHAAAAYHLDPVALHNGAVTAVIDGHADVVDAGNLASKAAQNTVFVTRMGRAATRVALPSALSATLPVGAKTSAVQLGYVLSTNAGPEGTPVRLVALVANNTGLMLDAARSAYRGGFSVALSNPDDPADRRSLNTPITVAITAAGASEVTPAPLDIADVGRWHPVMVTVPNFPGTTYRVAVSADPQDRGDAIDLPVSVPIIQVIAARPSIPGWGIGQTPIAIRASGLISPVGYPITLHNEHGSLDPMYVKLDERGVATATLRSDSAESTTVRVGDAGLVGDPVTVVFEPPWLFLSAAILGGLLGAFIRGRGRRHLWYALAIGVGSAVLMTLAYAVGIDWVSRTLSVSQLATSGEAVVFVLGAIAALVGVGALLPKQA